MSMSDLPGPIQPSGFGGATPADPPVALRNALIDAIGRRRRRIRSRLAVAGGVCVAVAAAVLAGGLLTGGSPERALAIDDGSEWVTVRILDGEAGAAEMTQELQDAGIDGEVQSLPSTPDYVGHWMGISLGRESPPQPCGQPKDAPSDTECVNPPLLAGDDVSFAGDAFRIRRNAIYKLGETRAVFYVGREPDPGEKPLDSPPPGTDLGFVYPAVRTEPGTDRTR
jgi:hypothetical protein